MFVIAHGARADVYWPINSEQCGLSEKQTSCFPAELNKLLQFYFGPLNIPFNGVRLQTVKDIFNVEVDLVTDISSLLGLPQLVAIFDQQIEHGYNIDA